MVRAGSDVIIWGSKLTEALVVSIATVLLDHLAEFVVSRFSTSGIRQVTLDSTLPLLLSTLQKGLAASNLQIKRKMGTSSIALRAEDQGRLNKRKASHSPRDIS